jgi:hypothetical protein
MVFLLWKLPGEALQPAGPPGSLRSSGTLPELATRGFRLPDGEQCP